MGSCPTELQIDEGEKEVQGMSRDSMEEPTDKYEASFILSS